MANSDETLTKEVGHIRAPTKRQVCEWVNESWNLLSKHVIKESFRTCGISVSVTGTEDDTVGCMKEEREGAGAAQSLVLKETQDLLLNPEENEDPFTDLDDNEDPENDYIAAVQVDSDVLEIEDSSDDDDDDE